MSLASNNKFTQVYVFQTIVSVLHSLHHLCGMAITTYIAIARNFTSARAGCSLSMSNCPDACNSLHVTTLLWMLFL